MRYRDLNFGTKQAIGFGLILLIMVGANVLAQGRMSALRAQLDDVSSNWMPRALALADLHLNTSFLRTNQLRHAVTRSEAVRREATDNMIGFIASINEDLDIYEALKADSERRRLYSTEEGRLYDVFNEQWEAYQDLSIAVVEHALEGETDAAMDLLDGRIEQVYADLSTTLDALVEVNQADAQAATLASEQKLYSTRRLIRGMLVGTLVLSIVIALLLVRAVTVPLRKLVAAVDQVAQGNFDVHLGSAGKDELGRLTWAFQGMAVKLAEAREHERREAALKAEAAALRATAKEAEAKALKAENDRKTHELEEARRLQLSMLPDEVPRIPGLEIGVYMETATEVGGDYYDFAVAEDGTLTVAVGDATGHGLQAGTMVTATKSLFNAFGAAYEPIPFFDKASEALKGMGFRGLYMALILAKFKDNTLWLSASGMPYTLVYRAATRTVETIELKGMPLGIIPFPYQQCRITLETGDTVLFTSDGISERFNDDGDMLGKNGSKRFLPRRRICPRTNSFPKWSLRSKAGPGRALATTTPRWWRSKSPDNTTPDMLQRTCRAFLLSSFLLACPLAAAAQPEEAPISVFGYFQSQFRYHDAAPFEDMATNSFVLQQMNLFLQKDLGKDLSALVNLEFLNSFSTTRATGALNVDEAWVRYRVGRML